MAGVTVVVLGVVGRDVAVVVATATVVVKGSCVVDGSNVDEVVSSVVEVSIGSNVVDAAVDVSVHVSVASEEVVGVDVSVARLLAPLVVVGGTSTVSV